MAELPAGTVTFLFTDIEGSTRLLAHLGDRYAEVLADQRRLLRAAVGRWGGREVDMQGDAFFISFPRARDALAAAVAAQRALAAHGWPQGVAVRVRMGLHTGEPLRAAGGYVGMDVHRAARICAAGYGGQILLSRATCELVQHDLPESASLRDLGQHRLKDLTYPEHIFQALVPDLAADFPPLKTLDVLPNNLPHQVTSFIGREREMAAVRRLLVTTYLLTLTGPGGSGKTRLAVQIAADVLEEFPGGVWLVELAALSDPRLVPQTAAFTLGVVEQPGRPLLATLTDHLQSKKLLLVLDNCEHLVRACADVAHTLLRSCSELRILATSREALGIAGELTFPVPPLSLPDPRTPSLQTLTASEAVRLFVERATLSRPEFALTDDNAPAVAQVCHRLDGIPLAIELAAARVKVLSVHELAVRLDDRFRLLTGGSRTALPRHQTLQAAIDWSHDLLSEEERALLRRLAVFAGGFTLEAAEAVCSGGAGAGHGVLDLLTRLVEKSLVMATPQDGATWYQLLETVRQYARDRLLESGEAPATRDRHRDWYVWLAERAEPELEAREQLAWLERLEREHDNFRAALEWSLEGGGSEAALRLAGALHPFWLVRGYWTEETTWLERALQRRKGASAAVVAKVLRGFGILTVMSRQEPDRARRLLEESVTLYRQLGDEKGLARALFQLGLSRHTTDARQAEALWEESLHLARKVGDGVMTSRVLINLAALAHRQGDRRHGMALAEESLLLAREIGDRWVTALVLLNLGEMATDRRDYGQAQAWLRESLMLAGEIGHKWFITGSLECLAEVAAARGQAEQATRLFGAAEKLREILGTSRLGSERSEHGPDVRALRAGLGEAAFSAVRAEGRAMTMEQAIAYALAGSTTEA